MQHLHHQWLGGGLADSCSAVLCSPVASPLQAAVTKSNSVYCITVIPLLKNVAKEGGHERTGMLLHAMVVQKCARLRTRLVFWVLRPSSGLHACTPPRKIVLVAHSLPWATFSQSDVNGVDCKLLTGVTLHPLQNSTQPLPCLSPRWHTFDAIAG